MAGAIEPFANISAQELLEHSISCHGWVRKKDTSQFSTLFRGDWPRRFMILHTGYLYLYKDADSKDISEKIPLKEYSVCDAQEVSKYKWTFKLIHESYGGKTLFFAVDSKLDLKTWKDCITDEKDIYWPILPPAHKTRGDLPAPRDSETNPCQRSSAPLPVPDPIYVNVDYNPRLNSSTTSTILSTPSRPLSSTLALPPRTSPLVSSGLHHDPKTREPPMQRRPVPDVRGLHKKPKPEGPSLQPRPHPSALGSSAQSLPRTSVPGPKPKGPTTIPRPVVSAQKAPHGRHITTPTQMRLPKSSSETCLTKPEYDNVVKELLGTPLCFLKEGEFVTSTTGVSNPPKPKPCGRVDKTQEDDEYDDVSRDSETNPFQPSSAPLPESDPIYVNVDYYPPPNPSTTSTTMSTQSRLLPSARKPPMQPRSVPPVPDLHQKPKPEGPSLQSRPHLAALGSSAQSLPRTSVPGPKPKGPTTIPRPVVSAQKAPHGRHMTTPSQMRLPKSSSETCLTKPEYDNVVKELTGRPLRIPKEGEIPTSTTGVSTLQKPKPCGRGVADGQSFREKHTEKASPLGMSLTLRHDMDRAEAESLLQHKQGFYILRNSQTAPSGMALSVCTVHGVKHHPILYDKARGYALRPGGLRFREIEDLLSTEYHSSFLPYN